MLSGSEVCTSPTTGYTEHRDATERKRERESFFSLVYADVAAIKIIFYF